MATFTSTVYTGMGTPVDRLEVKVEHWAKSRVYGTISGGGNQCGPLHFSRILSSTLCSSYWVYSPDLYILFFLLSFDMP